MRAAFTVFGIVVAACGGTVSDGEGDDRTSEQLIDEFCAKALRSCNDVASVPECEHKGYRALAVAVADACGSEFDAVLRCATSQERSCTHLVLEACPLETSRLEECRGGAAVESFDWGADGDCIVSSSATNGVSCRVTCPMYAAACTGPSLAGPLTCSCTEGPNLSATFAASDCSAGVLSASDTSCQ